MTVFPGCTLNGPTLLKKTIRWFCNRFNPSSIKRPESNRMSATPASKRCSRIFDPQLMDLSNQHHCPPNQSYPAYLERIVFFCLYARWHWLEPAVGAGTARSKTNLHQKRKHLPSLNSERFSN